MLAVLEHTAATRENESATGARASGGRTNPTGPAISPGTVALARRGRPDLVLSLQRMAGNRAVAAVLGRPIVVQRDGFDKWFSSIPGAEGSLKAWLANPINKQRDKGGVTNWGITFGTYQARAGAAGLPPGWDGFEAMTPDQAKLIGRQFWRGSWADKVSNDGVAIAMADWYWGAPNKSLPDALRSVLNDFVVPAPGDADDAKVIELLNSFPDQTKLLVALTGKRLDFHREVVRKDGSQGVFLVGWITRAVEQAWVTLGAAGTVGILEHRLAEKEIEAFLAKRKPKEIADIYDAASTAEAGGMVERLTRYRARVFKFKEAVRQGDWPFAAYMLNGFKRSDINELLTWAVTQQGNKVRGLLHDAATAHSELGDGSQLAQMTTPKQKK